LKEGVIKYKDKLKKGYKKRAIKTKRIANKKMLNKKGIFFTLISITIMAVFIFVFTPQADVSLEKDTQSIKVRISSIDNYVSDLEDRYFIDVLRSGTHKTILSLVYYIEAKALEGEGSFLTDLNSAFSGVIQYGKINGEFIDDITEPIAGRRIMEGNTLDAKIKEIKDKAAETLKVDTIVTIKPGSIKVSQKTPWEMESEMEIDFTVKSSDNIAEWSKQSIIIRAATGIKGFNDPYYLVNTNGAYKNPIAISTVEFDQWSIDKVREHIENGKYIHWKESDAPSFLMRFTNTISPSSCCGIESFVNPNKLELAQAQRDQIESYMDYLFWTHKFHTDCPAEPVVYDIIGLWGTPSPPDFNDFKLDIEHLFKYNIGPTDAEKTACP